MYPALTLLDQYARFQLIHGGYSPRQMANGKHYSLPYQPSQNHIIVLRVIQPTVCPEKISSCPKYMQKLIDSLMHDICIIILHLFVFKHSEVERNVR